MKRLTFFALALLAVTALALAACGGDDGADATPSPSPTSTPRPVLLLADATASVPAGEEPLTVARRDLTYRVKIDPLSITLSRVQTAGWDGCLGVTSGETSACTQIFVAGMIAWFQVDGDETSYRYHLGGDRVIAIDFVDGNAVIDDGSPLADGLLVDVHARLAAYARDDLALRLPEDTVDLLRIDAIAPTLFNDGCLGFDYADGRGCDDALTPGAIVVIEARMVDGNSSKYTYHVAESGFVATDFEEGTVTESPDPATVSVQDEMRKDLAERLGIASEDISVSSFREVTWRNGCLGVEREGQACTQALVDGFLAELTDGDLAYRYHGVGNLFVAASFEDESVTTISDPLPREN
jgi:hypothetical protein